MKESNFKIIINFYNAEQYIEKCILSALTQKYKNFQIIVTNDCSTDRSNSLVESIIEESDDLKEKIVYINNETRMGAMYNHQRAVFNYCSPNDIVVHLDGDDLLNNKKVLTYINEFYDENDCWMMYGQYKNMSNSNKGISKPYESEEAFNNLRHGTFNISHIRTFKAFAFHEIKNQDPKLSCFKDSNGSWYEMTCDVAMMYPLLEICGFDRVKYNDNVLYIYNDLNPICDYRKNAQMQLAIHEEINKSKKFKKL